MKKELPFVLTLAAAAALCGCDTPQQRSSVMATPEYAAREPIATSLFPSDQAVLSDEAIAKILSSKLELPIRAKVAIMRFPDNEWGSRYYGGDFWRDEVYLKLQEAQMDTLTKAMLASDQVAEVAPLPSLMTPKELSIPVLREAAVRMQADLLLVFRVNSDTYSQYRLFSKDRVKAYSTCELVLLDVRTGLVPFARVISRESEEVKQPGDLDLTETMRRAEQNSAASALDSAGDELVKFVKSAPKKGG